MKKSPRRVIAFGSPNVLKLFCHMLKTLDPEPVTQSSSNPKTLNSLRYVNIFIIAWAHPGIVAVRGRFGFRTWGQEHRAEGGTWVAME